MSHTGRPRWIASIFAAVIFSSFAGCVGLASHLLYAIKGSKTPAECKALEEKKVAIICVSKASTYGAGTEASLLARNVESLLKREVKDIKLIPQSEIENWVDNNGWNELDYRDVGRGVNAEIVVAIDLETFSLYEGSTLFKGRAQVTTSVYDMTKNGELVYRSHPPELLFPVSGGYHSTDTTEANFRRTYLQFVARQVAKPFHAYDLEQDYGRDPAFLDK